MKRKSIFLVLLSFLFSTTVLNSQILNSGIYVGHFYKYKSMMFYEIDGGDITPIGTSLNFETVKITGNDSIELIYHNDSPEKVICNKIPITKNDYSRAILNSNSEFNGFHYGPLIYEKEYDDGVIIAIKCLPSNDVAVTLLKLKNSKLIRTKGVVSFENKNHRSYRKLTFYVFDKIIPFRKEEWVITYSWITDYCYDNFFNVYIDKKYRFQIEVIDNGIR
jgi:hypothetical protein